MGTRWGRTGLTTLIGLLLLGAMASALWSNVFAFNAALVIQSGNATFSSSKIHANDAAFGMTAVPVSGATAYKDVLRAGFASATMNGFCLTKTESVPLVGSVTVKLTAGDNNASTTDDIRANAAAFDLTWLRTASSAGISLNGSTQIGLATTDLTTVPGTTPYSANPFGLPSTYDGNYYNSNPTNPPNGQGYTGIDSTSADLTNVYGDIWQAQIEGNISLPNLKIQVVPGTTSCKTDAASGAFPN